MKRLNATDCDWWLSVTNWCCEPDCAGIWKQLTSARRLVMLCFTKKTSEIFWDLSSYQTPPPVACWWLARLKAHLRFYHWRVAKWIPTNQATVDIADKRSSLDTRIHCMQYSRNDHNFRHQHIKLWGKRSVFTQKYGNFLFSDFLSKCS